MISDRRETLNVEGGGQKDLVGVVHTLKQIVCAQE